MCPAYLRERDEERRIHGYDKKRRSDHRAEVVAHLLDVLGKVHGTGPGQCMCCFRQIDRYVVIDHDHDCCPSWRRGKWAMTHTDCARGLICQDCNTIEGKIRTVYGPPYPRLIQEYLDRYADHRRSLDAAAVEAIAT